MTLRSIVAAVCVLALALVAPAHALLIDFDVPIDGTQAGTGSPGTGSGLLELDTVAMTLSVDLTFSGLLTPTTNAHIHCCAPPGTNAGVVLPFVPEGFPLGVMAGSFDHLFTLTPALVADILSGLSYVNIHTSQFPGGEIRGQVVGGATIPEPATLALVALALAATGLARRRRG